MLSQSDAEMSDTLHGQDVRLAFGCQRGRRPPATNSSGTSCWVCLQGREKKREEGRADIAYYVLPSQLERASAVSGWDCWCFSVVRAQKEELPFPSLCPWWASPSGSSVRPAPLNASQAASHGDSSAPRLSPWVLSMGRLWWSLWVRMTEVHAAGAWRGPFLLAMST